MRICIVQRIALHFRSMLYIEIDIIRSMTPETWQHGPMRNRARFVASRHHLTHQFITTCIVMRML